MIAPDGEIEATDEASRADADAISGAAIDGGHADGRILPDLVNGWARHPSVLKRYYTTYTTSNHQCLHVHSNGVCVLAVAPTHPILQPPLRVTGIAYRTHDSKNLMQTATAVHGKRKLGAVFILPRDMVCTATISDGSTVTFYGCVRGSVIEINQRLIDRPELLGTPEGYIAVLMPRKDEKKSIGEACEEFDREYACSFVPKNEASAHARRVGFRTGIARADSATASSYTLLPLCVRRSQEPT